jgi:hypothetical protein
VRETSEIKVGEGEELMIRKEKRERIRDMVLDMLRFNGEGKRGIDTRETYP